MIHFSLMAQALHAPCILAEAAGGSQQGASGGPNMLIMMVLMFVVMYFIAIRPQRMKQKEQEALQKGVQAGDEVVTIGGVHGVVTSVREKTITVRVAEGKIEFERSAVTVRKPKAADSEDKA